VTLGANIKGSPPLHFSWRKNEIGIPGASAPSLFLTAATAADSGIYVLTVTNDLGVLTATLPLQVVTPPRSSLVTTPTGLQLTWGTVAGQRYTLEEARTIQGPWVAWTNLYVGDGQPVTVDANAGDSGFYRILVE
jgi:hypothetical protein